MAMPATVYKASAANAYTTEVYGVLQSSQWFPVNIIKGGKQMDSVLLQLQTGWGKALYQKFLVKQVAASLYR